ncbi:unnamed protein product [Hermetia illucens]|uniref:GPI inositol-deacylase n=1 Tax=Hermetia illucens TaxID=343691 RepID=A0A7R8UHH8_HERIL|nr:protein SERAC1 [Hermetia illucens]CAD7080998.1 unnamed protein product [Hermetia illucens]
MDSIKFWIQQIQTNAQRVPEAIRNAEVQKVKNLVRSLGLVTACGLLMYEKYKINQFLGSVIDTRVLEVDKKRPDYIYIKYHIYRESIKRQREKEQGTYWINIIIHPIGKWWKTFKHSVAWRLLNIAQTGDKHDRLKAVRQLAQIRHLKDWDFQHLAQICDARTAVSLARSKCDRRWFLPQYMHGVIRDSKLLLNDLQKLLEKLKPNSCVEAFLKKYFNAKVGTLDVSNIKEHYHKGHQFAKQDLDLLKECVLILNHITTNLQVCEKILQDGDLLVIKELAKHFERDNETLAALCKVIANISLVEKSAEHFYATGWLGILSNWTHHPDLRLQVIAAKALENMDEDDPYAFKYPPNVYALYPRCRQQRKPKLDVVFIHGLLGGVFITWRQKDRKPSELGLYGKNAFYTSETDDVFLVGEAKRMSNGNNNTNGKVQKESLIVPEVPIIKKRRKNQSKSSGISDIATKELVETLETAGELSDDWEVVFPDCPLKSNVEWRGEFSVTGSNWINDDGSEEYTNCWPMEWLPEDFSNIRILGIDYMSAVSEWSSNYAKYCPCEKGHGYLDLRAGVLLDRVVASRVGENRPVVWIGHSMGGILCKHMLLKALDNPNSIVRRLAKNTKGIIFLGTPHRGSSIARWKQHMQVILSPSIEVKELEENSPKLLDLHSRFMTAIRTFFSDLKVVSIAEGVPTMLTTFKFPLRIVTEESAHIDYGDFYVLKDDHLSLSKPIFRQSFLYQRILKVIEDSINAHIEPDDANIEELRLKQTKRVNFFESILTRLSRFLMPVET